MQEYGEEERVKQVKQVISNKLWQIYWWPSWLMIQQWSSQLSEEPLDELDLWFIEWIHIEWQRRWVANHKIKQMDEHEQPT